VECRLSLHHHSNEQTMECNYDLFEINPDGSWRCTVDGHEAAVNRLRKLAVEARNEVRVMHVPTKSAIAVPNAPQA
jgi:VCBS repeat-containing protein